MRLIYIIFMLLAASPVFAQDTATVRLDGQAVFEVGPAFDDDDADLRARRIEGRLSGLLRNLDGLGKPVPRETPEGWTVNVSGIPVVTVSQRDAEDRLTTPADLAAQWSIALDRALSRARDRRLGWSGRWGAEIRASIESAFGRLGDSAIRIVPRGIAAVLVLALFVLFARGVRWVLRLVFKRTVEDVTVESLIKQFTYYGIIALGFFVAIDALGFDPTTVAAGMGLTGIVLGFALKDVLSNFVSGLLLLALRPFKIGDQIVVGDLEGSVERIELRATRLRAYDGRVLLVPNAEVFTSRIVNNTADPIRRGNVVVWLGYDTPLRMATDVIRDATATADGVLADMAPVVRIEDLGQDDIEVEVTFWTDSRRADFKNTASSVRKGIVSALANAGVGLPNPDVRKVTVIPAK